MAGFEASSSAAAAVGMMKNSTILLLLLLLLVTTTCQQVSASSSIMAPAANAPTTGESADHEGVIHMVGGVGGWTVIPGCGEPNFQWWADAITFHPGDTLRFWQSIYSDSDVTQVTRQDYETCTIISPLAVYTSRDVYVKLEREGDFYFVSGAHNYCESAFQKVHIKVVPRPAPPHSSVVDSSALPPVPHSSSAPASYADHHTSSTTSISPTQRMSRWIIFSLSLLLVVSYV